MPRRGSRLASICTGTSFSTIRMLLTLNAPEPTQDIDGENGNARSGGNAGERPLGAGFAVGETIATDHDGNQTCNLCNRAGEEGWESRKAGVEGCPAGLRQRGHGHDK